MTTKIGNEGHWLFEICLLKKMNCSRKELSIVTTDGQLCETKRINNTTALYLPLSFPDLVSRHQQKDGQGSVHSFLWRCSGGFPPRQRIRDWRPRGIWLNQVQGQQPIRHVLHPEHETGDQQLHGVQQKLQPARLPEIRPAAQRQQGTVRLNNTAQNTYFISTLSFYELHVCMKSLW